LRQRSASVGLRKEIATKALDFVELCVDAQDIAVANPLLAARVQRRAARPIPVKLSVGTLKQL